MKGQRTYTQYRVIWTRTFINSSEEYGDIENVVEKQKTYRSLNRAQRQVRILTSPEPWREWAPNDGPDDYVCCSGGTHTECGCGGQTRAQATAEVREKLPPIDTIRIDSRRVTTTAWETVVTAVAP